MTTTTHTETNYMGVFWWLLVLTIAEIAVIYMPIVRLAVVILLVSMATGLQGEYTLRSRLETVALGVLGIAMLNILRITVVAVVAYLFGQLPAVIVHDYGSVIATVAFLMAFWAFAYNVVLERIGGASEDASPEQGSNTSSAVATVPS